MPKQSKKSPAKKPAKKPASKKPVAKKSKVALGLPKPDSRRKQKTKPETFRRV